MKKFTRIFILVLIGVFLFSTNVFATTIDPNPPSPGVETELETLKNMYQGMLDNYNRLWDKISDIESTPKPDPTPAVAERPRIVVTEPDIIKLQAGRSNVVDVVIKNVSSYSAYGVVNNVTSVGEGNFVATIEQSTSYYKAISPSMSKTLRLRISATEAVVAGTYPITITHKYFNNVNEEIILTSTIQVNVQNDVTVASIVLKNVSVSPEEIKAGGNFNLKATVSNEGVQAAKNVQITIDNLSSDKIFIRNSTSIIDVETLKGGVTSDINIGFSSYEKLKRGSYPINLKVSFLDDKGVEQSKTYTYYVSIGGKTTDLSTESASEVIIENISTPAGAIGVGVDFGMTLKVTNTSGSTAKNIKITAKSEDPAIVPKSTSILQIRSLEAGKSQDLYYKFAPTAASKSQNYVIGFTLEYETGTKTEKEKEEGAVETLDIMTFVQYQGVNVSNPKADKEKEEEEEKKISVPKIIISDYKADPIIVEAGREFNLSLTFMNTNAKSSIKNIKAFLTIEDETEKKGNVFSPINSSNTFYIETIGPKGIVSKSITLFTVPDAKPKTYDIVVNFEYEDMENNPYTSKEIVGINVKQKTQLDAGELMVDEFANIGMPINVNFQFYNTGKVDLSNVIVTIDAEGFSSPDGKSTYFGNLSQGSNEYFDTQLIPNTPGPQDGKVMVSYEDDSGEIHEVVKDFHVNVEEGGMEMQGDFPPEGMMIDPVTGETVPMEETKPFYKKPAVLIGAGVVVVGIIATVIIIRRKKRGNDLDE